jgi:hypothetical protein
MKPLNYTVVLGVLVLGLGFLFYPREKSPIRLPTEEIVAGKRVGTRPFKTSKIAELVSSPTAIDLTTLPPATPSPHKKGSLDHQNWVTSQIYELNQLAEHDDADSKVRILGELRNPHPEIREAALTAIITSGYRSAVPYLQQLAVENRDAHQQKNINEAIQHLLRPSVQELMDRDATDYR